MKLAVWMFFGVLAVSAHGQEVLLMPDSTNNRMVSFNPFDGSVVNGNLFALAGGTTVHAMQGGRRFGSRSRSGTVSLDGLSMALPSAQ